MAEVRPEDTMFTNVRNLDGEEDTGPAVQTSLLTWEPHVLYTCASHEDCFRIATTPELYSDKQREHTTKYIEREALPKLLAKGDIQSALSITMFLHCPETCSFIRHRARELAELLVLKTPKNIDNDYVLRLIEQNLRDVLTKKTSPSGLAESKKTKEYSEVERLCLTVMSIIMKCCHNVRKHAEFNAYMKNQNTKRETIKAMEAVKCCDVAKAVEECKTGNMKPVSGLKPQGMHAVLVWILQELYQDPTRSMFTCLLRLVPVLIRKRKTLTALSTSLIVNSLTALLTFLFGRVQYNDRADVTETIRDIFKSLISYTSVDEIEVLLFHKNVWIRQHIIDILEHDNLFKRGILQINLSMAQRLLSHSLLPSTTERFINNPHPDDWQAISTSFAKSPAIIHFHIPPANEHIDGPASGKDTMAHENEANVLREFVGHKDIVQILGFYNTDVYRLPRFYITEDYTKNRLQDVLVHRSIDRDWFSVVKLKSFLLDIVNALEYIHEKNFVHRDLTAQSMFIVDESKVKLAQFHLASFQSDGSDVVEQDCRAIPTRWSAPESLTRRCFSSQSDVWMFGHVMYEVITHGCLPYSDHQGIDDAELVPLITGNKIHLCHELCIEDDLFNLICRCTNYAAGQRPSIQDIKTTLEKDPNLSSPKQEAPRRTLEVNGTMRRSSSFRNIGPLPEFPSLKTDRTPAIKLKRGIPRPSSGELPRPQSTHYDDSGKSDGKVEPYMIIYETDSILVQEAIPTGPQTQVWSLINERDLPGISPTLKICQNDSFLEFSLSTQFLGSLEIVCDSQRYDSDDFKYLQDLQTAAENLRDLHNRGWVHGELNISNILVEATDHRAVERKVWFARLTHMAQLPKVEENKRRSYVQLKESLDHRQFRRSAPEVLRDGVYSPGSDTFSFAFIIWEVFNYILPPKERRSVSEFLAVPHDKLYGILAADKLELYFPRPSCCSVKMYTLLLSCWNVERQLRPSLNKIITALKNESECLQKKNHNAYGYTTEYDLDEHTYSDMEVPEINVIPLDPGETDYISMSGGGTGCGRDSRTSDSDIGSSADSDNLTNTKPKLPPRGDEYVKKRYNQENETGSSSHKGRLMDASCCRTSDSDIGTSADSEKLNTKPDLPPRNEEYV